MDAHSLPLLPWYWYAEFYFTMAGGLINIIQHTSTKVRVEVNGHPYNFIVSGSGQLSIDGQQIHTTTSTSTIYPASAGYKTFVYQGITFYFKMTGGVIELFPMNQHPSSKSLAICY
jgi:hypothetical protein